MHKVSSERTYILAESINDESLRKLSEWYSKQYDTEPQGWVSIEITCGGGNNFAGYAAIDLMTIVRKGRIQTIGLGDVSSMAVPLFMAGEHRVVTPRTHFLLHEVGFSLSKDSKWNITELQNFLNDMKDDQQVYAEYVAARSEGKLNTDDVICMMRANTHLRGTEAVKLGIAHELMG